MTLKLVAENPPIVTFEIFVNPEPLIVKVVPDEPLAGEKLLMTINGGTVTEEEFIPEHPVALLVAITE